MAKKVTLRHRQANPKNLYMVVLCDISINNGYRVAKCTVLEDKLVDGRYLVRHDGVHVGIHADHLSPTPKAAIELFRKRLKEQYAQKLKMLRELEAEQERECPAK